MKYWIYIALCCAIFSCKQEQPVIGLSATEIQALPASKEVKFSTAEGKELTVNATKFVADDSFPARFMTFVPTTVRAIDAKPEFSQAIIFRYKQNASLSMIMLDPKEARTIQQGEKYVKRILSMTADEVKKNENGWLAGKTLSHYQEAKVGKYNDHVYYWILDCEYPLKDEFEPLKNAILEQVQFVE